MKRLIIVNGTMGVGKTATCNELLNILQPSVFLDGDWCWNMKPFIVTDETKNMVEDNITYLLNNFLSCSEYENIIFCWVMHDENITDGILKRLMDTDFKISKFTLTISEQALKQHIMKDVENNVRTADVLERSLQRIRLYDKMDTRKIDVSDITPRQAAEQILEILL
jgi:broad-specificity NMP kinase